MSKIIAGNSVLLLLTAVNSILAQEVPQMPVPHKQHEWLQQLAGEWDSECEIHMAAGQPPITSKGVEKARMVGGFWLLCESSGTIMDMPMAGIMTLGYSEEEKKFIGTWVDSMGDYMWKYVGQLDADGKKLTLETKGPSLQKPGTLSNYREVLELKDKDHKVFTSSVQGDDGAWTKMVTINFRRRK
jgi:hypothetical protein